MDKLEKNKLISSLRNKFDDVTTVIVAHYAGLKVSDLTSLRSQLRENDVELKVVKNRLAKIAVQGTSKDVILPVLVGPTVMAFSSNPASAAKILSEFAKQNKKLSVLGGGLDGNFLTPDDIDVLAKLPSLDVLRGKLVGLLQAPATKLAAISIAPAGQLARLTQAYADKNAA